MPRSPVLSPKYFEPAAGQDGWAAPAAQPASPVVGGAPSVRAPDAGDVMTVRGTSSATAVLFALLMVGAYFGWTSVNQTTALVRNGSNELVQTSTTSLPGWFFIALIGAVGIAFLTIFKPNLARFTGPAYSLVEGLVLGAISAMYEFAYDGIVLQAILATFGVFFGMLTLYSLRIIRVTDRMRKMVMSAMFGILFMYMAGFLFSLFGADIAFWNEPSPLGIGISFVIVGVAAFSLMLDFDFIENAVAARVPRRMEWFAAFGLMIGLVWLYIEILRLLALLRER